MTGKYYIIAVYICSLIYLACSAHAPYCHLWPAWLYHNFPQYPVNGTIFFWEKATEHKCGLSFFFLQLLSETFLVLRRIKARYEHNCTPVFTLSTRYSCQILIKLDFFPDRFSKNRQRSNFMQSPSSGSRDVPCGQTDRQTDMTKQAFFFRNFVNAPKNTDTLWLPLFIFIIVYANFLCWFRIALY